MEGDNKVFVLQFLCPQKKADDDITDQLNASKLCALCQNILKTLLRRISKVFLPLFLLTVREGLLIYIIVYILVKCLSVCVCNHSTVRDFFFSVTFSRYH